MVSGDMMGSQELASIQQIAHRLWRPGEFGNAALMVGSGFSKNASPGKKGDPNFPTWRELGRAFLRKLDETDTRNEVDPIRLASEYEAAFGRQDLESELVSAIPDTLHNPGKVHYSILQLPWADVFTTNYDTLLERASTKVIDKSYSIVRSKADIPSTRQPRIVKLHGTVPSDRPFIITHEDYRQYPVIYAPLVNLVQQSMMENIFCLVGFSADDPNFLRWIGWVRDNLGDNSPAIFLCGKLRLTYSQNQYLRRINITPIDLGNIVDPRTGKKIQTNSQAMNFLISKLVDLQPPRPSQWPEDRKEDIETIEIPTWPQELSDIK